MLTLSHLNEKALLDFPALFRTCAIPQISELQGRYSGQFVGPRWVRLAAAPALWLGGLPGWWGKELAGHGDSQNLLRQGARLVPGVPARLARRPSLIDGQNGVTLLYPPGAPLPLPWVADELRWLDAHTLLGMTMLARSGLQRLPFPFILQRIGPR